MSGPPGATWSWRPVSAPRAGAPGVPVPPAVPVLPCAGLAPGSPFRAPPALHLDGGISVPRGAGPLGRSCPPRPLTPDPRDGTPTLPRRRSPGVSPSPRQAPVPLRCPRPPSQRRSPPDVPFPPQAPVPPASPLPPAKRRSPGCPPPRAGPPALTVPPAAGAGLEVRSAGLRRRLPPGWTEALPSETHLVLRGPAAARAWPRAAALRGELREAAAWSRALPPPGPRRPPPLPLLPGGFATPRPPFFAALPGGVRARRLALGQEHVLVLGAAGEAYAWGGGR